MEPAPTSGLLPATHRLTGRAETCRVEEKPTRQRAQQSKNMADGELAAGVSSPVIRRRELRAVEGEGRSRVLCAALVVPP